MAYGDVGGAVTELVITCQTADEGEVAIAKGDALKLVGAYTVAPVSADGDAVFGQAMAAAARNGMSLPVKVRGICVFAYTGDAPVADGEQGVAGSATPGKVAAPEVGTGYGLVVKVDTAAQRAHVLL